MMLISSWLKSFQKNLQTRPRRIVRRSSSQASSQAEQLETRSLLAAPTLVAVRPTGGSFISQDEILNSPPTEITLQFNPGQQIDPATVSASSILVERSGFDGTFGSGNEVPVTIGYVGVGDTPEEVVIRFAENLPDDFYRITIDGSSANPLANLAGEAFNGGADQDFDFSLELGARIVAIDPQPVTRASNGTLSQARDTIVLYFNEDELKASSASNPAFYQLVFTNDTVTNLDDVFHTPMSATYDNVANTVTLKFAGDIDTLSGEGTYRLRVGTSESAPAAPIETNVAVDPGSSFATANTTLGTFSAVGTTSNILSAAIEPQLFPFEFPGANDEPGHREVEVETHLNGGADTASGITKLDYNFQDIYGFDPQGNVLHNVITEAQRLRAREVFEFYGSLLGIDFRETDNAGLTIVTGDLRALDPTIPTGPGGVAGLAGGGIAIMDQAEIWNDEGGGSWFEVAMHEIGHLLGLGHTYDLPALTVQGSNGGATVGATEPDYPGDNDIVHGQYLHRPDSIDIDLYQFQVPVTGLFTAEVMAERQADSSQLDSYVRLYRQKLDGTRELVAQNDDYFSEDSYLEVLLTPGTYFIGVSSTGNDDYDPTISNTGIGGTSDGVYDLRTNFRPDITSPTVSLVDTTDTLFDGDGDGQAGGVYNFWMRATAPANTLFVDKAAAAGGNGGIATPFKNINAAFAAAVPGQTVRIVGNGGADGDILTTADNLPYQIGRDSSNLALQDGTTMEVPKGVTVMIDAGAVFKLRQARIGVGSSTTAINRSEAALQILGVPGNQVIFTSIEDETIGTDTTNSPSFASPGQWGGISFRNDIDRQEGHFNYQSEGIFLNYVGQADIRNGGGNVVVDSVLQTINPININGAQPTIAYNTITESADSAMSADPDSFEELTFHSPRFQDGAAAFTSGYQRIGPNIQWNTLLNNSTNGLFVRVATTAGSVIKKLTVAGRFDDLDIVHYIAQNLEIQGTPGGSILDQTPPEVTRVVLGAVNRPTGSLTVGTYNYRIVFTDINDVESPASAVTLNVAVDPGAVIPTNSVVLQQLPPATGDYVGRRIYRSTAGAAGPYTLVAELDSSDTSFVDTGVSLGRTLAPVAARSRARLDASLRIDPGVIVKLEKSRIEVGIGAQLIAEGDNGRNVIFTSRFDDTYGAGGTFDTNDDDNAPTEAVAAPGDWGGLYFGHLSSGSLDNTLITFGGGVVPNEGDFSAFNVVEIHQASVRIRNSVLANNANGTGGTSPANRFGLFPNAPGTIFARGAQPVILNNNFSNNTGAAININANALDKDFVADPGRSTGFADRQSEYQDNQGPLVRDNKMGGNGTNGMIVRGETLTTQGVWDDTDIVHVVLNEVYIPDFHTYGGLRLESSSTQSLVVKLQGANAGFTANGYPLDIVDRIGGSLQIIGQPGQPVYLTSLADDTVGAGFDLQGAPLKDTNNDGPSTGTAGDWRSVDILQYAHDRNVKVYVENEIASFNSPDTNSTTAEAEVLGLLAAEEKASDENLRLGFEILGMVDSPNDEDIYSFTGTAGTLVWLDLDKTANALDTVVELLDANGNIVALSDNIDDAISLNPTAAPASTLAYSQFLSDDFYTLNALDAGLRVVLPGATGTVQSYFVRVRSSNASPLTTIGGLTSGEYQLQIRLQELDEVPGTQIRYSSISFATNGIQIIGQPAHSPLQGESAEFNNSTGVTQVTVGNVLSSDRAALSLAGRLSSPTGPANNPTYDIDLWEFEVNYGATQQIAGVALDGPHVPVTIDLDFADGFSRADTTVAVFNSDDELILIGRDSNIADDQPGPLTGAGVDDLNRGSAGKLDPFIGPVELPGGIYRLAVFPTTQTPQVLDQFFNANPTSRLIRVEPVNSTVRVAEERFERSTLVFDFDTLQFVEVSTDTNAAAAPPITDLFTVDQLGDIDPKHVVPFNLGDVTLFVSTDNGTKAGDRASVLTVDPFTGAVETVLGGFNRGIGDIAMRGDGQLHTFSLYDGAPTANPNNLTDGGVGNYLRIDTGDAAITQIGDDGVTTNLLNGTNAAAHNVGIQYRAMAYSGTSNGNDLADLWAIGTRSTLGNKNGQAGAVVAPYTSNILYNLNIASGAVDGDGGNRQNAGVAVSGAGTTQVEHGYVDTTFLNGGLQGLVTGMVTLDGGNSFYVVDDAGGLYLVQFGFSQGTDPRSPNPTQQFSSGLRTTFIRNIGADATGNGGLNLNFQGLALGPENVEGGYYSQTLFGITSNGEIFAFDVTGEQLPIFADAQTSISTGLNNVNGLDFGTLDYNLWHVTTNRGGTAAADDGHGYDAPPFDDSLVRETGGSSLYFGFEHGGNTPDPSLSQAASGNKNTNLGNNQTATALSRTLDFPGGAAGSVVSNEFSLENYDSSDKPTLYFSYWLDTEDQTYAPGGPNDPMRDAFRVFVSDESGEWNLLVTNDSYQDSLRADEFDYGPDGFATAQPVSQNFPDVVEAFDDNSWRQVRIDLSNYAGRAGLQLRFDFSTAGAMDVGNIQTAGYELYAVDAANIFDGDAFALTDNVFGQQVFEFDMGAHLIVPTGNALEGETFTVNGTTFKFTTTPAAPEDIAILLTDSAETVAQKATAHLNAFFNGIRITLPIGDNLEGESFTVDGTTFTYTATPFLPTDILAEVGDTADTMAFRTVQVVNFVLPPGTAFIDGTSVDFPGATTITFGGSLNTAAGFQLEGESFTVLGTTFTFTNTPLALTDIPIFPFDDATAVATAVETVVNAQLGLGTAFANAGRVSFPDLPLGTDGIFTGGTLFLSDVVAVDTYQLETFSVLGTTFTFTNTLVRPTDILAQMGDTADILAARATTAINAVFGPGTSFVDPLAPGRVSIPNLPNFADSLTRGATMVLQNIGSLEGYEFEVNGQTFRYLANPNLTGEILARASDSPTLIATRTAASINSLFGAGTAVAVGTRVSIRNLSNPNSGIFLGGRLDFTTATAANLEMESFTMFGTTITYTATPRATLPTNAIDINTTGLVTPADFAAQTALVINAVAGINRATVNGNTVDVAGAIDQSFGGSFRIVGGDAAALNGDAISINGLLFRFVDANPNFAEIDTDNNLTTTANNAVTAINNVFGAGTAFRVGTTVHVTNATSMVLVTDSNANGSVVVNDATFTPMTYTLISNPLNGPLLADLNDSPMEVDGVLTPLTHDIADTPITLPPTAFITATANRNRITIPSAPGITTSVGSPLLTNGGAGVTPGATAISINPSMTKNEVAIAIRQALADVYSGIDINGFGVFVGDITNIKGSEELVRIISSENRAFVDLNNDFVIDHLDVGPLGLATVLPGDEFGAFDTGFVNGQALRPGSLRGMNNGIEGVYVDDIIIGFAERGEMVTNAPANTGFTANDDVLNPDVPAGQVFLGIVDGAYDVEIRRATDYGETAPASPTNVLFRAIDTNDRELTSVAIDAPSAEQIPDRSTILLSDGVREVVLQFVDTAASVSADPGNVPIFFDSRLASVGTYLDSQLAVSAAIVTAINSQSVQDVVNIQATPSDTVIGSSIRINLIGNAIITPDADLAPNMPITVFDDIVEPNTGVPLPLFGDSNHHRDQGQIIVENSFITDSSNFGIIVDAATRGGLNPTPHAGPVRNTQEINTTRQVTGVVITNNVIALNNNGGILLSGDTATDPLAGVPFARVVNNTIVGDGDGTGILVQQNSAPTLLNNIVVDLANGINVDASSAANTVLGGNLFQNNATNSNVPGNGNFPLVLAPNEPLFVDKAVKNYYLAPDSRAIDSSLKSLADRTDFIRVKAPLGIAVSPILAPDVDVYGQLRGDDPNVATPSGQGANVFVDRGAIDRVDFFQPTASLARPEDQGASDLDTTLTYVWVNEPNDLRRMIVRLVDSGIGIDDAFVNEGQFTLTQDGVTLVDGVDYVWSYNSITGEVIFTAVTTFPFETQYEITIDNSAATGVRDLAGNTLAANRADGSTVFSILVTDGINDPPINVAPASISMFEDDTLVFSTANGRELSVSDADVHLGNNRLQVTLTASEGVLTLAGASSDTSGVTGLTFSVGDGFNDTTLTFEGDVADINIALNGLSYQPPQEYFNLLPTDTPPSSTPVTITMVTSDLGQFTGPPSPTETDTSVIEIDVVSVNDPPTFDPISDPPAVDEDSAAQTIVGFAQNASPGPANENFQTVTFAVGPDSNVANTGNIAFVSGPSVDASGTLTYEAAPDTNGTATFLLTAVDSDGATSAPQQFTITINAINDEPVFTLATSSVTSDEDEGAVGPFDLVATSAAGPATATDELSGQVTTFRTDAAPTVTSGNLVFTSFNVSATGVLTYQVAPDTSGTATFDMWLTDDGSTANAGDDNITDPVLITINVTAIADAPVPFSPNYVIDAGDALVLDGSGSTDVDFGSGVAEGLTYAWDLDNDGTTDVTGVNPTVAYSTLTGLGLTVPGTNTIGLKVTDTFSGTTVGTTATVDILTVDYGDAPNSYGTLRASNGAAHTIVAGFYLGASVDSELDASANDGADEDGIVFEAGMQADSVLDIQSYFTATASAAGKLDVWLDFNNNGVFETSEHLNGGVSFDVVAGDNTFAFVIPAGVAVTNVNTSARARLSTAGSLAPTGRADDGEVEDYVLQISPLLDAVAVKRVLPMFSQTSDLTPLLQWAQADGTLPGSNSAYNITLLNSLNQVVGFEENYSGTSLEISDALAAGTYTILVQSFNRAGTAGPTTNLGQFEVVPMMVTSPSGTLANGFPTVTWTPVTDSTDHYELQIVSAITGLTVVNETNLSASVTSYTVATELPIDSYRVRVRAIETTTGQPGDWSPYQNFTVATAPVLQSPTGSISNPLPILTWSAIPGAFTYDVRIVDLTDNIVPIQSLTGLTTTSYQLTTPLELGEYSIEVRAVTSQNAAANWSTPEIILVGVPTVISQPSGRLQDSTPTIAWSSVAGAENYDVEIFDKLTGMLADSASGLTALQYTVPDNKALPLGNYEIVVRANNLPAVGSTRSTASVSSVATAFSVSTPPIVTGPDVGIYDTTPTVTFTTPVGAVTSELEFLDGSGNAVFRDINGNPITITGITGNAYTVPNNQPLPPGQYRVRVRSYGNAGTGPAVVSDWSIPQFFQVGTAPNLLGPAAGIGSAPFLKTNDFTPSLTWNGSVAGETYNVWVSSLSTGTTVQTVYNLNAQSFETKSLPNGKYRYWVQANNGLGEKSAWSSSFDFQITTAPVVAELGPSFTDPTVKWQAPINTPAAQVAYYQIWFNKIDVTPNVKFVVETNLTATEYLTANPFPDGRYKVWTRAYVTGTVEGAPLVESSFSNGVVFEVGGRPIFNVVGDTADDTPLLTWSAVTGAVRYEIFLASSAAPSTPLVRVSDLTVPRFQVTTALPAGGYIAWVRAINASGKRSPWSLTSEGRFTVNAASRPVINAIPTSSDTTPTITWSPAAGADHYDIYISTAANTATALIRNQNVAGTTYTPTVNLSVGNFRVWVRAISAGGTAGPWSTAVSFTIVSNDIKSIEVDNITMLASLGALAAPLDPAEVTVSLIPSRIVSDANRQIAERQSSVSMVDDAVEAEVQVSPLVEARPQDTMANGDSDDVMANWDDAIWAEESAAKANVTVVESASQETAGNKSEKQSFGWLAGLAMLPPALRRRRKSED